ncbi:CG14687, partial [Drosophila busckii]
MYIYPSSPESASSLQSEESAAIKIQANFRGYRVRKQLHRTTKPSNSNGYLSTQSKPNLLAARRQQRQQRTHAKNMMEDKPKNANRAVDGQRVDGAVDANVTSVEDRCATKIQAGFRGFLVRKKQKIATDAAVKIQSSFRGFKARKEAEKLK